MGVASLVAPESTSEQARWKPRSKVGCLVLKGSALQLSLVTVDWFPQISSMYCVASLLFVVTARQFPKDTAMPTISIRGISVNQVVSFLPL